MEPIKPAPIIIEAGGKEVTPLKMAAVEAATAARKGQPISSVACASILTWLAVISTEEKAITEMARSIWNTVQPNAKQRRRVKDMLSKMPEIVRKYG